MDFVNTFLNWVVPPASLVMLAFAWPTLCFINACERLYNNFYCQSMENKVVIITGASSGIGEVFYLFFVLLIAFLLVFIIWDLTEINQI